VKRSYCWELANDESLHMYSSLLDDYLCNIDIPVDLISAVIIYVIIVSDHLDSIVKYFDAIQSSIQQSVNLAIPPKAHNYMPDYVISGWNDVVQDKHVAA